MFNLLKRRLGIHALEEERQFYKNQWTQTDEHFRVIHDHLAEIKGILKIHNDMSRGVCESYITAMARLGIVLTELKKKEFGDIPPENTLSVKRSKAQKTFPTRIRGTQALILEWMQREKRASIEKMTQRLPFKTLNIEGKRSAITTALSRLCRIGRVERVAKGLYQIRETQGRFQNPQRGEK